MVKETLALHQAGPQVQRGLILSLQGGGVDKSRRRRKWETDKLNKQVLDREPSRDAAANIPSVEVKPEKDLPSENRSF